MLINDTSARIERGGISTFTSYDAEAGALLVGGWYLPVSAYDEILVYLNERFLGRAEIGLLRNDVHAAFPQYAECRSGWRLYQKMELSLPCKIVVKCMRHGVMVKADERILEKPRHISLKNIHHGEQRGEVSRFCSWLSGLESFKGGKKYREAHAREKMQMLFEHCCNLEERFLALASGGLFFYNMRDLWAIVNEILVHEDYWFESSHEAPLIIDGGANIGMAAYYFKHLYPKARILAFEPNPELVTLLRRNVTYNRWDDVTVFPYALSDVEEKTVFYCQPSSLAGSLERRNSVGVDECQIQRIPCSSVRLSKYLEGKHVDFLKLDIEGCETRVLEDIEEYLEEVDHVFVEFHDGVQKGHNYISTVLGILERNGFDVMVRHQNEKKTVRPMGQVGKRMSEEIWGRRCH